ncbi:hypothetical protein KP509_22G043400 [Ceratopteris richardii]|uniref:Zinc-finger domain-containing protein n=1 Tax=Ceratopteris richardii TaxID=49495 RepID=A0A8T2S6F0_CERRI|nr:hypothetical protein KP509_22G043400 [Ceratopteris richardii]
MALLDVIETSTPLSELSSPFQSKNGISSVSKDDNSYPGAPRTGRCKNPGRRVLGGRIYDSVLGVTCHWCRQKTVEDHVFCCRCPVAFCGGCLKNRHGEDIEVESQKGVKWTCPRCRGGCGEGCKHCCNCGPCRKAQGLDPTGLLVHTARACGFTNVHDYLINQKTGESEDIIARRKLGKGWCQTDYLLFCKKQKRIEDDCVVEVSCKRRLNFGFKDQQSQEQRAPTVDPVGVCKKEKSLTMAESGEEQLHKVQEVQRKEGEMPSPVSHNNGILQIESLSNKQNQVDLKSSSKFGSDTSTTQCPKSKPELYFNEESRRMPVTFLCEPDKNRHTHAPSLLQNTPSPSFTYTELNPFPIHRLKVKQETLGANINMKEGVPNLLMGSMTETGAAALDTSRPLEQLDEAEQSVQVRDNFSQFMQINQKIQRQDSDFFSCNVGPSTSEGDRSSPPLCNFNLDIVFPDPNMEPIPSSSTSPCQGDGTQRSRETLSSLDSNFHLYPAKTVWNMYPGNLNSQLLPEGASQPSNMKEAVKDRVFKLQNWRVKVECQGSEQAYFDADSYEHRIRMFHKDSVCSKHTEADNLVPLATIKKESEGFRNEHAGGQTLNTSMATSKAAPLFDAAKVKVERQDTFSFGGEHANGLKPRTSKPALLFDAAKVKVERKDTSYMFSSAPNSSKIQAGRQIIGTFQQTGVGLS